jgi:hypothetical protein
MDFQTLGKIKRIKLRFQKKEKRVEKRFARVGFNPQESLAVRSRLEFLHLTLKLRLYFRISHKDILVLLPSFYIHLLQLFNSFHTKPQNSFEHDHILDTPQGLLFLHKHVHSFCISTLLGRLF